MLGGCAGSAPAPGPVALPRYATSPGPSDAPGHEVAGALPGSAGAAALTVADAASRVEVRTVDLPGLLYRVTTPYRSGLAPRVTGAAARLTLRLRPTGDDGPDAVLILLNRAVRWEIRLPAGGGEEHLELSRGRLTALELGAAGLVRVRLPPPVGLVAVTVLSGVGTVEFTAPRATAMRLHLRRGAGETVVPWGAPHGGVAMSPGWGVRANRYAIETRGGVGCVRVFALGPWR
ncbi:MAG: hypothetical protein QOC94_801 [Actinoplanes sp.]|nr:hypothetical protein [Actinoplanes sp.]